MPSLCSRGSFINQAKINAVSLQSCGGHASSRARAYNENIRSLRFEGANWIRCDSHGEQNGGRCFLGVQVRMLMILDGLA